MSHGREHRSPAHQRKLRHTAAGVGLVVLGAALGLIGSGLYLNARRKPPNRNPSPFTLGADPPSEHATTLRDEPLPTPGRSRHD